MELFTLKVFYLLLGISVVSFIKFSFTSQKKWPLPYPLLHNNSTKSIPSILTAKLKQDDGSAGERAGLGEGAGAGAEKYQQMEYPGLTSAHNAFLEWKGQYFKSYSELKNQVNLTFKEDPTMTMRFPGYHGLGNLMFSYASGYGIAHKNGRRFEFIAGNRLSDMFYTNDTASTSGNETFIQLSYGKCCAFEPVFNKLPNVNILLAGYFQSWKYFYKYKDEILKQFTFKSSDNDTANSAVEYVRGLKQNDSSNTPTTVIGVHIRSGDMLSKNNQKHGHKVADKVYIDRAMSYFKSKFKHCIFIVCSNDLEWAKDNLEASQSNIHYSEGNTAQFDLEVLASCDHVIITVGTFGWWAGYLSKGDVVYYKDWPRLNSKLALGIEKQDYFPPQWTGL